MKWQKKYELYTQFIKPEYLAGLSVSDCLEKFDISRPTLLQYLKEDGLIRDTFETLCIAYKTTSQEIIDYYLMGNSLKNCAKKFGIHNVTLSIYFKKKGISVRTLAEANKLSGKDRRGKLAWNKDSWKNKVSEKELVSYYIDGHTLKECHDKFNVDIEVIRNVMKQNNVFRGKSAARVMSLKNHPEYIENLKIIANQKDISGSNNPMFGKPGYWAGKHISKEVSEKGKQTRLEHFGSYFSNESIESIRKNLVGVNSGDKNPMFGKTPVSKFKYIEYNGEYLDSSYELEYVKYLDSIGVSWKRNYKRIHLQDEIGPFTTVPDFIVNDKFIEIKGWFGPRTQRIIKALKNSNIEVTFLGKPELKKLGCKIS